MVNALKGLLRPELIITAVAGLALGPQAGAVARGGTYYASRFG